MFPWFSFSHNSRTFVVIPKVTFQIMYCKVNQFNPKLLSSIKHYRMAIKLYMYKAYWNLLLGVLLNISFAWKILSSCSLSLLEPWQILQRILTLLTFLSLNLAVMSKWLSLDLFIIFVLVHPTHTTDMTWLNWKTSGSEILEEGLAVVLESPRITFTSA